MRSKLVEQCLCFLARWWLRHRQECLCHAGAGRRWSVNGGQCADRGRFLVLGSSFFVSGSFAVSALFGGKRIGGKTAFYLGFALRHLRYAPSIAIAIPIAIWRMPMARVTREDVPAALRHRRKLSHAQTRRRGDFFWGGCMSLRGSSERSERACGILERVARGSWFLVLGSSFFVSGSFAVSVFICGKSIHGEERAFAFIPHNSSFLLSPILPP